MNIQEILDKYDLKKSSHESIEDGACIMELVSYIANEPWSDRPKCACSVLTSYAIGLNDRFNDEDRQKLKRVIPKLLNSRDDTKKRLRANFLCLQSITVFLPILTEALELPEITTKKLRSFKDGEWVEANKFINESRPAIREAARKKAAYAYAYADAAYAAAAAAAADAAAAAYAAAAAAAAYAAADAAYADAAYADAAYAAAAKKNKILWTDIKDKTIEAAIAALEQACDL